MQFILFAKFNLKLTKTHFRYGKHPLRFRGRQRHDPATQPERVQSGLMPPTRRRTVKGGGTASTISISRVSLHEAVVQVQ